MRCLLIPLGLVAACGSQQPVPPESLVLPDPDPEPAVVPTKLPPATPLVVANTKLGLDLYHRIRTTRGNVALSPASISIALAMTWAGAKGETAREMQAVLHHDTDADGVRTAWAAMIARVRDSQCTLRLELANGLFVSRATRFQPTYVEKTKAAFGATVEAADFNTPMAAREQIDRWVAEQARIVLPAGSITPTTRLVIVNAIRFAADWQFQFMTQLTSKRPFKLAGGREKRVPMMHQIPYEHRYAKLDGVKVLELPYQGGEAAMWLVLPDRVDGLADVERSLDAAKLETWAAALHPRQVTATIPKFTIAVPPLRLGEHLRALGMQSAFDDAEADFTGIATSEVRRMRLFLGEVVHHALVRVDEQGTEASAATEIGGVLGGGAQPEEFTADHPFLFFIVDRRSRLVLFMGRVEEP